MEKLSLAKITSEMVDCLTVPSVQLIDSPSSTESTHEIDDCLLSLPKNTADIGFRFRWMDG